MLTIKRHRSIGSRISWSAKLLLSRGENPGSGSAGASRSRSILIALLAVWLLAAGAWAQDKPQYVRLTILHTNDTHGHLLPFSYPLPTSTNAIENALPGLRDIGGIARRATLVREVRAELGTNCLLLDAGDIMDGTPFSVSYKGLVDIAAMNAIGYSAMTTGNHEYNMSEEQFGKLTTAAEFPIVCANVKLKDGGKTLLPPWKVFDLGGVRVGVFGLTTTGAATYKAIKDRAVVEDPIIAAKRVVAELKAQSVDAIIALTHIGYDEDLKLAEAVSEIDVVVGGHSHTYVKGPTLIHHGEATAHNINATIVTQDFQWGGTLGRLDLVLYHEKDGSYDVMSEKGRFVPVNASVAEDPKVAAAIDEFYQPMGPVYDVVLGTATGDFVNSGVERSTVNLVADGMREMTGADIALQNYGGTRESIPSGTIKMWDLASMLPFDNQIMVVKMTGKRLREGLGNGREMLSGSGMTVVYGDKGPLAVSVNGAPLDEAKIYTVALTDYIQGAVYGDVKDVTGTAKMQRDMIAEYIKKKGTISPVLDGRVGEKQVESEK